MTTITVYDKTSSQPGAISEARPTHSKRLAFFSLLPVILLVAWLVFSPGFLFVMQHADVAIHLSRGIDFMLNGVKAFWHDSLSGGFTGGTSVTYPPLLQVFLGVFWKLGGISGANAAGIILQFFLLFGAAWLVSYRLDGPAAAFFTGMALLFSLSNEAFSAHPAAYVAALIPLLFFSLLRQKPLWTSLLLVFSIYLHYLGAVVWFAVAVYWLLDRSGREWVFKPLAASALAALPLVIVFANALAAGNVRSEFPFSPELNPFVYLLLGVAIISFIVAKIDARTKLAVLFLASMLAFYAIALQPNRFFLSSVPILAVCAGRLFSNPAANQRIQFVKALLAAIGLFLVIVFVTHSLNGFALYKIHSLNEKQMAFYQAGRNTYGLEDAAKMLSILTNPGEVIITNAGEASLLGFLAQRKVSSYSFPQNTPKGFNVLDYANSSRAAFYKVAPNPNEMPHWFKEQAHSVYKGPAGSLYLRESIESLPCNANQAFCNAFFRLRSDYCYQLPTEESSFCLLNIATTGLAPVLCEPLQPKLRAYCLAAIEESTTYVFVSEETRARLATPLLKGQ